MAFGFSENRTKVTLYDPAQVENVIVTRRLRFFGRSDRWEGTTGLKKNRARRRDIPRLGFAHLSPEQARAVPVAKDLHDGPVVKQLLEWIAELENRRPHKK